MVQCGRDHEGVAELAEGIHSSFLLLEENSNMELHVGFEAPQQV